MAKRRLISLLPSFQQTDDLKNFFGSTVDEVFQPGTTDQLSGYIGRTPDFFDPKTDFYIGEPTASRQFYQLEPGMVSINDASAITHALTYPDFVAHLGTIGANITDEQRLFETEYYTWAPPINIDMIANFNDYYWFGDAPGDAALPSLTITTPMTLVIGDGITTIFPLPASIAAVPIANETPMVYVDTVPTLFTVVGDTVVCDVPPPFGSNVLICRTPDLSSEINGQITFNVTDINAHGVTQLSSGMRIKIIDAVHLIGAWDAQPWDSNVWDFSGSNLYMVDGVGLGIRLTSNDDIVHNVEAQYVTIDRSSSQPNGWSARNSWVHKSTYGWSGLDFSSRKATRPIIEFIRDLVLYDDNWSESTDPLFMLYDLDNVPLNDPTTYPGSDFAGNRIFGFAPGNGPVDTVLRRSLSFDSNGYVMFQNDSHVITYHYDGGDIFGMPQYATEQLVEFTGGIIGFDLTVNAMRRGSLSVGQTLGGPGVVNGTVITGLGTGTGGAGTYQINLFQNTNPVTITGSQTVLTALWHKAAGTTEQTLSAGFYVVPDNLQANPTSDDVSLISESTWLDHFRSLIGNQVDFVGNTLGINNYRDTLRDLSVGTEILQHRAPLLKAMLVASDTAFDVPQSIRFVDQEYNRFRNKFIRRLTLLDNKGTLANVDPVVTPGAWVTAALKAITRDKNLSFPFALSPVGGGRYFIPATPTALGMLPAAVPAMIMDATYATPQAMVQGHDGSLTPAFNDWRDNVLLALEKLIYDNLPAQFKTETRPVFDIAQWIGNRYATPDNGYSYFEFTTIMAPMFEFWAQKNGLDYRTNVGYDPDNSFTWNFNGVVDIFGNTLPGNWRGIYQFYYGTDSPHTRPWEMLGFVSQPTWWVGQYGSPPYMSTHATLWADLRDGKIAGGVRAGIDPLYARPDLLSILPVDTAGRLLDPANIGLVTIYMPVSMGTRPWQVGDLGPVEYMWFNTPSYRYALALASFLMKPARFMEECWDSLDIGYIGDQWVDIPRLARPLNSQQYVHGETRPDGTTAVITGVQQWIADYLRSRGVASDDFGASVRGLNVRLMHQMAGFVSNDAIKTLADNFGLLPEEDVKVVLYSSPSTSMEVYSGVIMEWTGTGWRAIGYDARDQYFTIIPPDINGPKGVISLASAAEPSIVTWHPNTYYPTGILASYQNTVYEAIKNHTSGLRFENLFWTARPDLATNVIRAPRVITYARGLPVAKKVPYGTVFTTYQEVADFILGWQRYLVSRGWVFDGMDNDAGQVLDWSLSVREFLVWAQIQWQPGNFIAMSPGQQGIKINAPVGTILNVEDNETGFFGLLNRSAQPIREQDANINRLDGLMTITANDADIFSVRLEIASIEHAAIFSNVTIFNDNVYLPLFNMRQGRLRLINWRRSTAWAGRLDAPGFVILDDKLKSDFEKAANDVRYMFDIELADVKKLWTYARHNVGFQERSYMNDLLLADSEQFEFYQGMIQQKGAPSVFEKLMRSNLASNNSNVRFLEEWAFLLGQYGAPIDPFVTFQLTQTDTRNDPQIVRFATTPGAPLNWIVMPLSDPRWFDKPDSSQFFPPNATYSQSTVPVAGPVRVSDATYTLFNLSGINDLYSSVALTSVTPFAVGTRTWVYERLDGTYTVLQSFETSGQPNAISSVQTISEDDTISFDVTRIFFQLPITLTNADVGSLVVIDGQTQTEPELLGVQTITAVNVGGNFIEVDVPGTEGVDFTDFPQNAPFVRVLREVRFPSLVELNDTAIDFQVNDIAWVDDYFSSGQWAVMQWDGLAWHAIRNQPLRIDAQTISDTVIYAENVTLTKQQIIAHDPIVNVIDVIDPLCGLIAGISDREIDFRTSYDPARYNSGNVETTPDTWGALQVGRVWWNIATVKFLDPYTDTMGVSTARDNAELAYRTRAWAQIAPNTSVDVYEWIKSTVDPISYTGTGTPYLLPGGPFDETPSNNWVEESFFDPISGDVSTIYYFWVKGLTTVPLLPFRHNDITTVAQGITNPSSLDLSWMGPITTDALIVSGVVQFLNDIDSVMKVRLTLSIDNPGLHDEWVLMRRTDETSLPPDQLWNKLQSSLMAYNVFTNSYEVLPDPSLAPTRNTGIGTKQNMFKVNGASGSRSGLMDARRAFVESVNDILAKVAVAQERQSYIETITRGTEINQNLIWTQPDESWPYEPPPSNEWNVRVQTLQQRNALVAQETFLQAVTTNTSIRVLVDRVGSAAPLKGWSIWIFNPTLAAVAIAAHPTQDPALAMAQNADSIFTLATAYETAVDDIAARNFLLIPGPQINVGDRILVRSDVGGFWSIYKYLPSNVAADANGFVLWRVQSYKTTDFFNYIDWFADGYSAANPPIVTYDTISARDTTEGTSPTNLFVRINDDGSVAHTWNWSKYDTDARQWKVVAIENGTLALSQRFYDPTRLVHGVGTTSVSDILNRDGTWELYELAQALRFGGLLLDSEINELWFDMVNFCHAQQTDVSWAFKTSFMSIVGYNVPLNQIPFIIPDPTDDLLLYVNEVKPYHVKVREFSTQYSLDPDLAHVTVTDFDKPIYLDPVTGQYRVLDPDVDGGILETAPWKYWWDNYQLNQTPVRGFDITIVFDRYSVFNAWDASAWDDNLWDVGDRPETMTYVHTFIVTDLASDGPTIQVDDIRFFPPVSDTSPLTINIGPNSYQIGKIVADVTNVSTLNHGLSGTLHTVSGDILASDGVAGNQVEGVVMMPSAFSRIAQYYTPTAGMTPNDEVLLMNLGQRSTVVNYITTIANNAGDTVLTVDNTIGVSLNQQINGPRITKGTFVVGVTATTITMSAGLTGALLAGAQVAVNLPNWIDGFILQTFMSPVSEFDMVGFDTLGFDTETDIYNSTYDGSTLAAQTVVYNINPPLPSRPGGFDLRSPYYAMNHPEERIPFTADDGLQITVTANADVGGPPQIIKTFDVSHATTSPVTLFFDLIAQASAGVMVFRDGVRGVLGTDFTVDHLARTVSVNVTGITLVQIHAFGFGGNTAITEQTYIGFASNPIALDNPTPLANLAIVQNGTLLSGGYTVGTNGVTLNTPPSAGTDVALVAYQGGANTATTMVTQRLTYNGAQQWTLNPRDTFTMPEHAGTIVEVNGRRLAPMPTFYGHFTPDHPYLFLPLTPQTNTALIVYINGVQYTTPIPFAATTSPGSPYPFGLVISVPPPTNVPGRFVVLNNLLVALDPNFTADVAVVMNFAATTPDYTVTNGVLKINTALIASDRIEATIFRNAASMGLKTLVYPAGYTGEYFIPPPFAKNYELVAMSGLEISPGIHYELVVEDIGWDATTWDALPWDIVLSGALLDIPDRSGGAVVITMATAQAMREAMTWKAVTNTPAFLRMSPSPNHDHQLMGQSVNGPAGSFPLFDLHYEYVRQTPYTAGRLVQPLAPTDTEMVVALFLKSLSTKLRDVTPFVDPLPGKSGVVFIGNERIEYFAYERSGDQVTLSGLRRGTYTTAPGEQRSVATGNGTGTLQSFSIDTSAGLGPLEVRIDGVDTPDYVATSIGSAIQVVLTAPSGSFVTVAMTSGFTYPVGMAVYNGSERFVVPVPVGEAVGNREIQPMHHIIAG